MLRNKISASMVALLLSLGLVAILITHTILLKVLKAEFQHKGLTLAKSIVANSLIDVLTQNTPRLKQLIENEKKSDKDIAYIFVIDSTGHILTHTFNKGFPMDLVKANTFNADKFGKAQLLNTQMGIIYDIAAPISLEKSILGQVRIGILQNGIQKTIMAISLAFIGAMFLIMLIGIFLAYKISSLITRPVSKLVEATKLIQRGDFSVKIDIKAKDEIELLASAFNEMASRLNSMIEEKKRLTVNKERDRIAIDFHDGCAQDLANIIKRLELARKLLNIDPQAALKELDGLRETTKDTLNRAREVIFDLKTIEDGDFNLLNKLTVFIKDYEKANNITVKSDFSGPINNILPSKAEAVFCIIREAFVNIKKHAQANNAALTLDFNRENNLTIGIKDDEKGFDVNETALSDANSRKLGIISMRRRAISLGGSLNINSAPGQGAEISAHIPLREENYPVTT